MEGMIITYKGIIKVTTVAWITIQVLKGVEKFVAQEVYENKRKKEKNDAVGQQENPSTRMYPAGNAS